MKLNQLTKIAVAISLSACLQTFIGTPAKSAEMYKIIGLTSNNTLVKYGSNSNSRSRRPNQTINITKLDGNVLGIDYRPANGMLYALTDTDKIYTINCDNGVATFVSNLSVSFSGGFQSGVDFNPVVDRLRVVASNGQNYRINVDTGMVTVDTLLNYDPAQDLGVTASAYINSRKGATATMLFNLDYDSDALVSQAPPNEGKLTAVGLLGFNLPPVAGFDVVTNNKGENVGFIAAGKSLYTVDLSTGAAKMMGNLREGNLIGVAVSLTSDKK